MLKNHSRKGTFAVSVSPVVGTNGDKDHKKYSNGHDEHSTVFTRFFYRCFRRRLPPCFREEQRELPNSTLALTMTIVMAICVI